jgi:hypothetical protein
MAFWNTNAGPLGTIRSHLAAALRIGIPAYDNDLRGCCEVFACAARLVLRDVRGADEAKQDLALALRKAAGAADANQQARLLRRAFEDIIDGAVAVPPFPDAAAASDQLRVLREYLNLAIQIGAPSYDGGDQRGCYEVYACAARMLLAKVPGAEEPKSLLRGGLEQGAATGDPSQQAWILRHAFDAICLDLPEGTQVARRYLAAAIEIGAPAYNAGDPRGCYEVYACTARLVLNTVAGAEGAKKILRKAVQRCEGVSDVSRQAWILRDAFDAVLGSAPAPIF